jgi:diketogulonate reductase-like aldo/keto reductase
VTTSSKEQRLSDYLRIFTFNLTPKEIEQISETGAGHHKRGFWSAKFADDDTS